MAQLKDTTVTGNLNVTNTVFVNAAGRNWLDGQKNRPFCVTNGTTTTAFYPWLGMTNQAAAHMIALGSISKTFYVIGSNTSRTENGFDCGFQYDFGNSIFYATGNVTCNSKFQISGYGNGNRGLAINGTNADNQVFIYNSLGAGSCWLQCRYNNTTKWYSITNVCAAASSDIRLKTNIKPTEVNALSKINLMKVRQFNRIDEENKFYSAGFIADELEKIDSNMVIGKGGYIDGHPDYKQVNTLYVAAYAIKGIQELNDEIISLKNKVAELEKRVQS